MDMWRYFEVTHSTHDVMNPSSVETFDELGQALALNDRARVLDIGCGHAEMLLRWHDTFGIAGIGVDASPYHAARAQRRVEVRGATDALQIVHGKGETYEATERFDVACCVGTSWAFGGHEGSLRALTNFAKPGGAVVVGEPYWIGEPPAAYLAAEGLTQEQFHDLEGCLDVARDQDLSLIWMARSSGAEWDQYEMRQSASLDAFARANPDDPDLAELRNMRETAEDAYIRWGNQCLGWALWAFRTPG